MIETKTLIVKIRWSHTSAQPLNTSFDGYKWNDDLNGKRMNVWMISLDSALSDTSISG